MSCSVTPNSATPWTVAHQAPLSMGFSRQEYCSGLPIPSPGDLPNPGMNLDLPHYKQVLYHLSHQGSQPTDYFITVLEMLYLLPIVNTVEDYTVRERITAGEWSKIMAILEVRSQVVLALNV